MASEPLEKKLDRYYDDIMEKLLEILEAQRNLAGEQKDLKKDLAKVKEYVLENKTTLERIDIRTEGFKTGGVSFGNGGASQSSGQNMQGGGAQGASAGGSDGAKPAFGGPPAGAGGSAAKPPSGASPQNLKDFLSQQLAIFDVKVLNAFIKSTKEIVKSNSRMEPSFIKPIIESKVNLPIIIAGKMNLSRDKGQGSMALCFEQNSAAAVTRSVFMLAEDARVTDSDIRDVTSEICNQICGKSKLALKNEGYSFEIDMPEIHQGNSMELYALLGYPKIVLQFEFTKSPFYIYFWG